MSVRINTITRHSIRNYGSFLQALATNELLRRAGGDPVFVDYRQSNVDDTGWSFAARGQAAKYGFPGIMLYASIRDSNVRKMGRVFEPAIAESLALSNDRYRSNSALLDSSEFDTEALYCVGSDQVWNISTTYDNRPYYMDFAPFTATKFSLASSIGMESLPANDESLLVDALSSFAGVSVREHRAAEYLASLKITAHHHVDPVLAVEKEFWDSYAGEDFESEPYLLVYQLNSSKEMPSIVHELASKFDLPIRRIEYWRHYKRGTDGKKIVLPTPREFVRLFRDASFVVTDSFHGAAFSTIFDKAFVAVPPPKFTGRISSLLSLTQQTDLMTSSASDSVAIAGTFSERATNAPILDIERKKVSEYLRNIIGQSGSHE